MAKMDKVESMLGAIPEGGHLRSKSGLVRVEPLADGSVRWTSGKVVTTVDARTAAKRLAAYKDHALDAMEVVEPGDEVPPREVAAPTEPEPPVEEVPAPAEVETEHRADDEAAEADAPEPRPAADGELPPGVRISRDGHVKIATNKPVMARWKSDDRALNEGDGSAVAEILGRVPTTIEVRDESEYATLRESAAHSRALALEAGDRQGKSYAGAMGRIIEKLDATRGRLPAAETAAA